MEALFQNSWCGWMILSC